MNKIVKKIARRDKRAFADQMAKEAEEAASKRDQRDTPTVKEVEDAIRSLKNGKVTGIDAIHAEMLKVDLPTSVGVLSPFFNEVWEREEIPEDWRNGLIVKIPKKGTVILSVAQ